MARQPPRVGAQLAGGEARRFVDVQRDVAQPLDRVGQARPFLVGQAAGAQMGLVDAADRPDDPHRELRGAHFHREHRYRQALVQRDMLGDVDRERGLAHRRPRGEHHHVAGLEARGHAIEVDEAGRHTRDVVRVVGHFADAIHELDGKRVHALETLLQARAFFADVEDLLFGFVEDLVDRLALRVEGVGRDFFAGDTSLRRIERSRTISA